jgi:hypothetical protein
LAAASFRNLPLSGKAAFQAIFGLKSHWNHGFPASAQVCCSEIAAVAWVNFEFEDAATESLKRRILARI